MQGNCETAHTESLGHILKTFLQVVVKCPLCSCGNGMRLVHSGNKDNIILKLSSTTEMVHIAVGKEGAQLCSPPTFIAVCKHWVINGRKQIVSYFFILNFHYIFITHGTFSLRKNTILISIQEIQKSVFLHLESKYNH